MIELIFVGALWFAGSIAVGWAASIRGRAIGKWIFLSLLLSPLFTVLLLIAAGPLTDEERRAAQKPPTAPAASSETSRDTAMRKAREARSEALTGSREKT